MIPILERELMGYFLTATGYVFTGIFMLLSGICYTMLNLAARSGNMLYTLQYMGYIWMLLCPVAVPRLLAGEYSRHTDTLLFSSPLSVTDIVAGKFLAAVCVMLTAVVLSLIFPVLTAVYGHLYLGETVAAYLGFIFQGIAYIAMDLFVSSFAANQISASAACIGVNLFLWLADLISEAISVPVLDSIFSFISLYRRSVPFSAGRISLGSIVYFIAFIFIMCFLCVRVLDARRWRNA